MEKAIKKLKIFIFQISALSLYSLIAIVASYSIEYFANLVPCRLCLYQRYLYIATCLTSSIAIVFLYTRLSLAAKILGYLAIASLFANITTASYKILLERRVVIENAACGTMATTGEISTEEIERQISSTPLVSCSERQLIIRFFDNHGLSLAELNLIYLIWLALFTMVLPRFLFKKLPS